MKHGVRRGGRWAGIVLSLSLVAVLPLNNGALAKPLASQPLDAPPRLDLALDKYHRVRSIEADQVLRAERRRVNTLAPVVGDEKSWPAVDDANQFVYDKLYTLRGIGNHIEVWVASDVDDVSSGTDFPDGDCRNGVRTLVTDQQVADLIAQFDSNIYPKESAAFSVPVARDGTDAPLAEFLGLPPDYYQGEGDNIVTLVDNIRDTNFYDTDNQNTLTSVAGFFSRSYNEDLNRNVMTIDSYDWLHQSGPNPAHEPTTDPCTNAPAYPTFLESVFAHEYQHLLEYYEDPDETTWIDEGLAMWAETLTGYSHPDRPITALGYEALVQCFLGYLAVPSDYNPIPHEGGPENSLNLWGDQTDFESESLCDYGATSTMMHLLAGRYGQNFMKALHRDDRNGFESLRALLRPKGIRDLNIVIDDWAAMVALDGVLDDRARLIGGVGKNFQVSSLDATINWDNDQAFSSPGAPPNGSDYVRLRDGYGYLSAKKIRSISFDGVTSLEPLPVEWAVDADPPGQPGDPALSSGSGDNLDRSIVKVVAVPTGSAQLNFDAYWSLEEGYDYAYVQVSLDGGASYVSVPCSDQTDGPFGTAFNGESGGFVNVSCDLSAWAGQSVALSFRVVTDSSLHYDGFWVDNAMLGATLVSDGSTLTGWSSPTQLLPVKISGYTVRLVAYDGQHRPGRSAWIATVRLNGSFDGTLSGSRLKSAIGTQADVVGAIVTYHDPTEQLQQYAPYTLTVNGVLQPGG